MELVLTRGLPASGKSVWAETLAELNPYYVNVNRDDLRLSLTGRARYKKFTNWRESVVSETQYTMVAAALNAGKSVIISDTNLNPDYWQQWEDLASLSKAEFRFNDFLDVPYGVCIERDSKREYPVGQSVIEGMYRKYRDLYWKDQRDHSKPSAIICDLDGTLCDISHRSPYNPEKLHEDGINDGVWDIIETYLTAQPEVQLIFCSGRDDVHEDATRKWLDDVAGFEDCYQLYMREHKDSSPDYVVKRNIYDKYIRPNYFVKFAIDDRNQIVHMWRELGIPTFQCNYGYF